MLLPRSGYYLTLRNRDTGEVYARYKMGEGDRFSVTFIHSVNKYPLTDTYEIENKTIYVEETTYCSFGAGVQTELTPAKRLTRSMWTAPITRAGQWSSETSIRTGQTSATCRYGL